MKGNVIKMSEHVDKEKLNEELIGELKKKSLMFRLHILDVVQYENECRAAIRSHNVKIISLVSAHVSSFKD